MFFKQHGIFIKKQIEQNCLAKENTISNKLFFTNLTVPNNLPTPLNLAILGNDFENQYQTLPNKYLWRDGSVRRTIFRTQDYTDFYTIITAQLQTSLITRNGTQFKLLDYSRIELKNLSNILIQEWNKNGVKDYVNMISYLEIFL